MEALSILEQAIGSNPSPQQQKVFVDTAHHGPCTDRQKVSKRCHIKYQSLVTIINSFVARKIFTADVEEKSIIKWDINLKNMPDEVVDMIKKIRGKK